jgi:uncharacterized membrane protein
VSGFKQRGAFCIQVLPGWVCLCLVGFVLMLVAELQEEAKDKMQMASACTHFAACMCWLVGVF